MPLHVVRHPLVEDALGRLRNRSTPCDEFRRLARRVSLFLAVEATRDLALSDVAVQTPLEQTVGRPRLVEIMLHAEPGWINERSWEFWRGRLSLASDTEIPNGTPRRAFHAEMP